MRLCCTTLTIPFAKYHDVDTTPEAVRLRVGQFVADEVAAWGEPIPAFQPGWLTSTVRALADAVRAEAAFNRLPVLADALQDAGCEDPLVLDHLRVCPDHSPNCWVVEIILGAA